MRRRAYAAITARTTSILGMKIGKHRVDDHDMAISRHAVLKALTPAGKTTGDALSVAEMNEALA